MHHPVVGTRLSRRLARYPFVLTGAFRIDEQPADMVTTILQSASGAILGVDRLLQKILVGAGASGHVTSQAALAVHRMDEEITAEDHVALSVEAGGFWSTFRRRACCFLAPPSISPWPLILQKMAQP